jgi:subtilisin family serine protease
VRKLALLLALVATATLVAAGVAFTQVPEGGDSDRFIVVLEDDVDSPSEVANGIARRQNLEVGFVYSHALNGFSAAVPEGRLAAVRDNPRVAYVERDIPMHAVAQRLPWGVDRIQADRSSAEAGNGKGVVPDVTVYVIDSGIYRHADLKVVRHVNRTGDGRNTDCNGHGTHVAGILAARDNTSDVVGVAPGARLIGVKVLDCRGNGPASAVIKGIDWVTRNARRPAVANISISSEPDQASQAVDDAVRGSVESGVFYSIAAGNFGEDACNFSPARVGAGTNNGIVTTAATNKSNREPSWSNYGSCVDLWAPGAGILSTQMGGGMVRMTGTSMASPHVGGTGALYLSGHTRVAPARVESVLKADSVRTNQKSRDGRRIRRVHAGGY